MTRKTIVKLAQPVRDEIRAKAESGASRFSLAQEYGVAEMTIYKIIKRLNKCDAEKPTRPPRKWISREVRQRVIELADGIRTTKEISALVGISALYVAKYVKHLPGYGLGHGRPGGASTIPEK